MENPPVNKVRGKGFQHERRLWVKNDINAWHIAKIRQHTQDPTKLAGRSSFEGGFVSHDNSAFAVLLRRTVRGGGRTPGEESTLRAGAGIHGVAEGHSPQFGFKGKALMHLREQEAEEEDKALQLYFHRSRKDAQRRSQRGERLRIGPEKEAAA